MSRLNDYVWSVSIVTVQSVNTGNNTKVKKEDKINL
jgi:hypothetical protein